MRAGAHAVGGRPRRVDEALGPGEVAHAVTGTVGEAASRTFVCHPSRAAPSGRTHGVGRGVGDLGGDNETYLLLVT